MRLWPAVPALIAAVGCWTAGPAVYIPCEAGPVDASVEASVEASAPIDTGVERGEHEAGVDAHMTLDADLDGGIDALFNVFPPGDFPPIYLGGDILLGPTSVYFLWYGDWSASPAPLILEDMMHGLTGDAYQDAATYDGILQAYYEADGGHASGQFVFAGSYFLGYSAGKYLSLGNEENVIANSITYGVVPYDSKGIYVIMSSADVEEDLGVGTGFCQDYCAFHRVGATNAADHRPFRYAFVGDPMQCPDGCTMKPEWLASGATASPNGDWGADGMATTVIHELFETVTDPSPYTGWADPLNNAEIGDVCGWRFDPTYVTDGGSRANVHWGDRDFLIQQMWVLDDAGGHCDLHP